MSLRSVYCLAPARAAADLILHQLKEEGYASDSISVVLLDAAGTARRLDSNRRGEFSGPLRGASAEIRGVVAWLHDVQTVVLSNIEIVVGGPIARAFADSAADEIADGLNAFGMPNAESVRYQAKIAAGGILVAVRGASLDPIDRARAIFASHAATDVFTMVLTSAAKPAGYLMRRRVRSAAA
ncbi:MAG TPA: hypothetical protein VHF69_02070 [Candidatus Synoicihabitans sp.]|nr:hypothetical protein [Candidatus Synoicihabitans sp.]